ncbi:tRNA uridine-5-carboxymethylaminomethyl(34) synthesis GTPase MnmE [Alicyclobacillus dauci]|uniref:tRNA modification GTPase MnmE n=1 Tax=Alicyclobacillus dauci TaxID=1475485 RepID=A0ABY6Z306_9BACL|nr:tRNA uridine-5-carboxymethylaminomethyl(34) synthesis GTPase MnmE [Alicyclobacillus dauci]WAH37003.1 tRNA uridine-5-carboxymethylaminomethyl(34) synthesis GTPase MnmE [Alicyclobacillus dauci]
MDFDTITAIATALGEASISVVRVSGPSAAQVCERIVRTKSGKSVHFEGDRKVIYGQVVHPASSDVIDEGLILWMPGPHSYTAEDVVELQVHGGVQLVQNVLEAVLAAGARMAEPGEFTKRAFLNGRIDLSQAEAVMDLIRAKTDFAGKVALQQVKGRFRDEIRAMRKELIALQAHVEVTIDYPEHDVEDVACRQVLETGASLLQRIDKLIASANVGRILRDGIATAIVGRPNVGKSSLLNAMLRSDRAIVTDIPGTTRDVLEEYVNVHGIPLKLVDTAGIRETEDIVERIGVDKSRQSIEDAELVLVVLDGSVPPTAEDDAMIEDTKAVRRIFVVNKVDKGIDPAFETWLSNYSAAAVVQISAKEEMYITELENNIARVIQADVSIERDSTYMTNARQKNLLEVARTDLINAMDAADAGATLDLIAVALQSTYEELGLVIGEETGEDLLDEIFSRFCLGK